MFGWGFHLFNLNACLLLGLCGNDIGVSRARKTTLTFVKKIPVMGDSSRSKYLKNGFIFN